MAVGDRPFRLAIVAPLPVQYHAPFFSRLAQEPGIESTVLYGTLAHTQETYDKGFGISYSWDIPLLRGYRYKRVPTIKKTSQDHGPALISPRLLLELRRSNYDGALIYGWGDWFSRSALVACTINKVPFFLTGDASPLDSAGALKGALEHFLQTLLVRMAAGCLYTGTLQRVYFERLGVPDSNLFLHPLTIDNDRFFAAAAPAKAEKNELRADFGLPPDIPLIVFCGKLLRHKRPMDVLEALRNLQDQRVECGAVFIGDGELKPLLESVVVREGLDEVYFLGFVNQSVLPKAIAACDVLVLPSEEEPRGMVTSEAMATGLPVVISHRVGQWGYGDIVVEGRTGFVFNCGDTAQLAAYLKELVTDEKLRVRMGSAALERMKSWGLAERVEGIKQAIESIPRE